MKMKIGNGIEKIVFQYLYEQAKKIEIEKTKWMNKIIVKNKIKFSMIFSQDKMVFLDTKIVKKLL